MVSLTSKGFPLSFGTGCGTITVSARLSWGFWVGAGPGAAGLLGGEGLEGGVGAPFWLLDDNITSAGLLEPEIFIIVLPFTIKFYLMFAA